jgi:hypothetical protein
MDNFLDTSWGDGVAAFAGDAEVDAMAGYSSARYCCRRWERRSVLRGVYSQDADNWNSAVLLPK